MNRVALLLFLVMCGSTSSLAQSNHHSNAARVLQKYSLVTLMKYCDAVGTFSNTQQPRVFARTSSVLEPPSGWVEFSSMDAWRHAGKPQPLALVWYKDDRVARVSITPPDGNGDGNSYTDYCYRPDGSLARMRSVPEQQANCDQSFLHCRYTFRVERLYPPGLGGQRASSAAQPPVDLAGYSVDLRPLKSERTSFMFAPMAWPEYLNVWELPFNPLLYISTDTAERFVITVLVQDSFKPHLEITIPTQLNRPFRVVKMNGSVKTSVSGILKPAIAHDEYALTLTVSEPRQSDTQKFCCLELDKPQGAGSIQHSTVFGRTVTVSRARAVPVHAQ